jgi:dTDP-4-dehydrorhamnose 3,5-epimerase
MHFQNPKAQGKLVRVPRGLILDVTVDVRRGSPTFGRWWSLELSDENFRQLWIPPGFAHGFLTLSEVADVEYRCTDHFSPETSRTFSWDDPYVGVEWPDMDPILSESDSKALPLSELEAAGHLPEYVL